MNSSTRALPNSDAIRLNWVCNCSRIVNARFARHADAAIALRMLHHQRELQRSRQPIQVSFLRDAIALGKSDPIRLGDRLHLLAGRIIELAARTGKWQVEFLERLHDIQPRIVFVGRTITQIEINIKPILFRKARGSSRAPAG